MKVGDLFVALGFQVDDKKLKEFNDGIQDTVRTLGKVTAGAAAAIFGINAMTSNFTENAVKLKVFSDQTGLATDEVQRFYNVAGRLNTTVTLDNVIGMFTKLKDVIAEAKLGKGPLGEASMLGISNLGNSTPMEVLTKLRQNYRQNVATWGKGDERVVQQLMQSLGIGPEYINVIRATDEEFAKLAANPILNQETVNKLNAVAKAQANFRIQWDLTKASLGEKFGGPVIDFFTNLVTVMQKIPDLFTWANQKFNEMTPTLKLLTVALTGAAGAAALLAAPFAPIVAGVAALLAALNDLGRYLRGEPSLIGTGLDMGSKLFDNIKNTINQELLKTPAQHQQDRERILNGESGVVKWGGQQSSNQTNHFYIQSTGSPKEVAGEVVDKLAGRDYRQNQINGQFDAAGMYV